MHYSLKKVFTHSEWGKCSAEQRQGRATYWSEELHETEWKEYPERQNKINPLNSEQTELCRKYSGYFAEMSLLSTSLETVSLFHMSDSG